MSGISPQRVRTKDSANSGFEREGATILRVHMILLQAELSRCRSHWPPRRMAVNGGLHHRRSPLLYHRNQFPTNDSESGISFPIVARSLGFLRNNRSSFCTRRNAGFARTGTHSLRAVRYFDPIERWDNSRDVGQFLLPGFDKRLCRASRLTLSRGTMIARRSKKTDSRCSGST